MEEKRAMDGFGAAMLVAMSALLAFNQVVIKITGEGFGPVFQAGLRSAFGLVVLLIWIRIRRVPFTFPPGALFWGGICGVIFGLEFVCLYIALDLTTVARASVILYSMPVWLAMAAHVLLPGEALNRVRTLGLVLAMAGVVLALADRSGGHGNLLGDLLALGAALCWAGIALVLRLTPLSRAVPEMQMLVIVAASTPVLLGLAPLMGDLLRDPGPIHLAGLAFQSVFVILLAFLLWTWLISIYRAGAVASFSFLTPVFAVILGWWLLDEQIGTLIWAALSLVAAGIILVNRR